MLQLVSFLYDMIQCLVDALFSLVISFVQVVHLSYHSCSMAVAYMFFMLFYCPFSA